MSDAVDPPAQSTPRPAETTAVQLTRVEGSINLILFQMDQLTETVKQHTAEISALQMFTQRLADEATASHETALSLAKALKDADEARRSQSEQTWTPFQRIITVMVALAAVAGFVIALLQR